ncbi:sodium:solute symporter [Mailhella massiliensis]|uniref:Sodium:solute symporter family protein n=1 Tax=Mailhella massiliensis TaxID=1903261 RepID=A0A921AXN3_9BACT|nr:hypothetical protein [Mailhella massiliensis]HJD97946.1 hypothetical protein [Mailhella massiliensis]
MLIFCLYAALLLGLGLRDARRSRGEAAFFVNGRSSGAWHTGFSLIASCIGGSATMGMAGLAWQVGTPSFWWLGSGACGLALLTLFLAKKVRASGAYTMPEIVSAWLGPRARTLVSFIILPAWLAILAAQFTAMGKLTHALASLPPEWALFAGAAVITAYSCLGGQASVIRSDLPQCLLLIAGVLTALLWLFLHDSAPLGNLRLEIVNEQFGPGRFSYFMLVMGGSYLVCPMLFGRILSARNEKSALRGCWFAVAGLLFSAAAIVVLGVLCRGFVPEGMSPDDVLSSAMALMPSWAGMLLLAALLSAVLSSADSCVVTASTVLCNDILGRRDVALCRKVTLLLGAGGLALAARGHGILDLLLMANDIYVCGVAVPVFVAMLMKRGTVRPSFALAAMAAGGAGGLSSAVFGEPFFAYAGMALSAAAMLAGRFMGSRPVSCPAG